MASYSDLRAAILQCFDVVLQGSGGGVAQAEQQLQLLEQQSGYGVAVAQIAVEPTGGHLAIRQLAAVALRRYVKHHWAQDSEDFVAPMPQQEEKMRIRSILPAALGDPEQKIRTAVAMAIASLAHWDWPEEWPDLVQQLAACLASKDSNLVKGAIRCLDMFADGENLSDEHLPLLLDLLCPHVLRIFSDYGYTERIRVRAISILYSLVRWLAIVKQERKDCVGVFFQHVFPNFVKGFAEVLGTPDDVHSDCGMKIAIMKVLIILVGDFPKQMQPHLVALLGPIWQNLTQGLPIYERVAVNEDLLGSTAQDSEGDVLGFESLVTYLLEFIHCIVQRKAFRPMMKPHLADLFYLAIKYMQMTADQEEMWSTDPNEYVASEDDEFNYSVRISAISLIEEFLDMGKEAFSAFGAAISRSLQESAKLKEDGVANWWKIKEAVVTAVGNVSEDITEERREGLFDVKGFIGGVLSVDLNEDAIPFLRGRALWCASKLAESADVNMLIPFLTSAATSLQTATDPIPVKVGACRAVGSFCPKLAADVLNPYIPTLITGVTALLQSASDATLHLVLDTLVVVVRVSAEMTAQYQHIVAPYVLAVWSKHAADTLLVSTIEEILEAIAAIESCYESLRDRILPIVETILKAPQEMLGLTESSIGLLTILVNASGTPLSDSLARAFSLAVHVFLRTEESNILQRGPSCLGAFVRKAAPNQLIEWKPDGNTSALDLIIQFVAKLLSPAVSDPAAIAVGPFIGSLITKMSAHLGNCLIDMLQAVLRRLETAKMPSLIQALVLVFARLVNTNTSEVLDLLSSVSVPSANTSGLQFVLGLWAKWHPDFQGAYYTKISAVALGKLLQLEDARLDSIHVPGELQILNSDGIATRSKTKGTTEQWTLVPLKVKIVHLLLQEHQIACEEEKMAAEGGAVLSDEEEDWEDEGNEVDESTSGATFVDAALFFADEEDWDDDEDDPDAKDDPIYSIDLKKYVEEFMKDFAQKHSSEAAALAQNLSPMDKHTLQHIMSK